MAIKLNWKHAQVQVQPVTAVSFSIAADAQLIIPTHIFPMADGAGVPPVDVVHGDTFDTPVGTVDVDYSFGAPAYGLYDGVDHTSRQALEVSSASGGVSSSNPDFLDPLHDSFGIYLQYRIVEGSSGATVSILRKGGDHVTPALGDVTFQLHYDETTHRIYLALAYNTADAGSFAVSAYVAGTVDDAAHHWVYAKVNFTAKTLEVFGDTDAGTVTDLTAMIDAIEAAHERFSNTTSLVEIGANSDLNANDHPTQIAYMAIFRGRASELFTQAVGDTLWAHGTDQNLVDNGAAIIYTRPSRVGYPIAADAAAMWAGSGGGGSVQVPLEFNENWGGNDLLSLGCHPATENILGNSNVLTAWTAVTATANDSELVSERGFREMGVVNATANGGYVYKDITGLTALTTYRVSYYAATATGAHTARVEATRADLTTTLASLESALTTTRGRRTFTFTTLAAETQTRLKLFGGTAATQTNTGFHCVMVTEGTSYGPCIYNDINQDGTTETLSAQTQVLNVTGNLLTSPDEGSVWAAYIQSVQDTGAIRKVFDIHSDADNEDRRFMEVLAIGTQDSGTYNAIGVSYQSTPAHAALTVATEYNRSLKWRRKANLAAGAYTLEDAITAPTALTQTVVGAANTEGTGGHTRIFIACAYSGGQQLSGLQALHLYGCEVRQFNIIPVVQTATTVAAATFTSDPGGSGGGTTDHGALSGLAGDDHTQYLRVDATRQSGGVQAFPLGVSIVGNSISDVLISADAASVSDAVLTTAGWVTAHTGNSLDAAYDQGGVGFGRSITADAGAVLITNPSPNGLGALGLVTTALGTGVALNITNAGSGPAIRVSQNTDQLAIFGRARLDSRVAGAAHFSNNLLSTLTNFALQQTSVGETFLNAAAGHIVGIGVNGVQVVQVDSVGLHVANSTGCVMRDVTPNSTTPVLVPNRSNLNTGIGGAPGELSIITGGVQAVRVDSLQGLHASGNMYVKSSKHLYLDDGLGTFITAPVNNILQMIVGSINIQEIYTSVVRNYVPLEARQQAIGTGTAHAFRAYNNTAAAAGAQQYSPMIVWEGQGWKTAAPAASQQIRMAAQLDVSEGAASPSGDLVFRQSINGGAYKSLVALGESSNFANTSKIHVGVTDATGEVLLGSSGNTKIVGDSLGYNFFMGSGVWHQFKAGYYDVNSAGNSATAPAIRVSGVNAGIFSSASQLGISTAQIEAVHWDSAQNQVSAKDITAGGDLDAAGGFRRSLDAVYVSTPTAGSTYAVRRDGGGGGVSDDYGWHVCARAGSAVELSVYLDSTVTAGQVDYWVQKSVDGGATFSNWWGSAAAPVASLKFGGSINSNAVAAKDAYAFAAGDVLMVMLAPNATWAGGRRFWAQLTVEC